MNVTAELLFLMLLVSFSTILYIFIIQRNVSSLVKWIFNSIKPHLLKLIAKYLPERVQMYLRGKGGKLFKRFKESSLFMPVLFTSSFYCYYVMTIRILILLDFFMVFGVSRYAFIIFFFVVSWTSIAVST